jgi:cytosine/adenosine deaminase-related metal-dependent hydrolase
VQNKNRLIKNIDWVITVDAGRRMITDGAIAIAGDRIEAVKKSQVLENQFKADEVIDGRGLIAIPGLIDTNVATLQQLGRGAALLNPYSSIAYSRLSRTERARPGPIRFVAAAALEALLSFAESVVSLICMICLYSIALVCFVTSDSAASCRA